MDKEKPIQKLLNWWDEAYRFALMHCARRKRWQQGAKEKQAKQQNSGLTGGCQIEQPEMKRMHS